MKKSVAVVGWALTVILVIGGISSLGVQTIFMLAAAVLVCPLFRNNVKLPGKVWIPVAVVLFLVGVFLSPHDARPASPSVDGVSSDPAVSEPAPEQGTASTVVPPAASEPAESPSSSESESSPVVADAYTVALGGSASVAIQRHPVLNGDRSAPLFDIGVGETSTEIMAELTSDDLSAFIGGLDFETYGYSNIVLSFEDGTGLVFQKGASSFTDDYGIVDVAPGNFEMVERLGAIWNEGEGWYYMTVEEMAAEDAANG